MYAIEEKKMALFGNWSIFEVEIMPSGGCF